MKKNLLVGSFIAFLGLSLFYCEKRSINIRQPENFVLLDTSDTENNDSTGSSGEGGEETNDKIFLVDLSGKRWDITDAVNRYKFDPKRFKYGLGPYAIKPILNPQMLSAGQSGYPNSEDDFLIIGTAVKKDIRAYPLYVLVNHEVVDESFDSVHVAVA
jgi:hypothetical protein